MISFFRVILVCLVVAVLFLGFAPIQQTVYVEIQRAPIIRKWIEGLIPMFVEAEMKGVVLYDNKSLDDLLISKGGQPLRTLILGSWRTGSTFLSHILQSHPGTLYIYEPDMFIGGELISVLKEGALADRMGFMLEELYKCRWDALDPHLARTFMTTHSYFGTRIKKFCEDIPEVCEDLDFLSRICESFPVQLFKTTRYRLDTLQPLLTNSRLNVKVLYLVRDPRATLNSRSQLDWCRNQSDCENATVYCRMLEHEFHLAQEFVQKYPRTFKIVRYEELASNAFSTTGDILKFLHMSFDESVQLFLQNHTRPVDYYDPYDTHRDSKAMPNHWIKDMVSNMSIIQDIQKACSGAMNLWGYKQFSEKELWTLGYYNGTMSTKSGVGLGLKRM